MTDDRIFTILCFGIMFASLVYAEWAARRAHLAAMEVLRDMIKFLDDLRQEAEQRPE
jgi:hypothetical protein